MPVRATVPLDAAAGQALCDLRDHAPKAYLPECAAALQREARTWPDQWLDPWRQPSPALLRYTGPARAA